MSILVANKLGLTASTIFLPTKNRITRRIDMFTADAMPMAHGFVLTAMGSGTGIGLEVSSRGGNLTGKNTSRTLSQRPAKTDLSSKALPRKASSSWPVFAAAAPWGSAESDVE